MKPVRVLVSMAIALAIASIWLVRADEQSPRPSSRSAQPPVAGSLPLPASSPIPLNTEIEAVATGRTMNGISAQPRSELMVESRVVMPPATSETTGDAPSNDEVWAKIMQFQNGNSSFYETARGNIRIVVEKVLDKADPVKVYPLAGPCQLIHRYYKCTVKYDELYWSDYPIPFNQVDHKVEVVTIDKKFLRRAPAPDDAHSTKPGQPVKKELDSQIDRISREIEQLKRKLQLDRQEQERVLDRLIKELKGLKHQAVDETEDGGME